MGNTTSAPETAAKEPPAEAASAEVVAAATPLPDDESPSSSSSSVASPRSVRKAPPAPLPPLKDTAVIFDARYLFHVTNTNHERPERLRRCDFSSSLGSVPPHPFPPTALPSPSFPPPPPRARAASSSTSPTLAC
jgi:hypothetical protein